MDYDYKELLDDVYTRLPKKSAGTDRFEVPPADVIIVGSKTIVKNLDAICAYIRRKPADVAKYLSRELAVPGATEGARLVLQGRFSQRSVADRMASYVKERVICKECGKPDTSLEQIDRNVFVLKCEACGARSPVRN